MNQSYTAHQIAAKIVAGVHGINRTTKNHKSTKINLEQINKNRTNLASENGEELGEASTGTDQMNPMDQKE